ncbi:MAG: type IV pilus modification PilV family protein [Planctomycetota bacterium]|jgi:prepilin-type N-terminal cleavage/methylation domain-containing protein
MTIKRRIKRRKTIKRRKFGAAVSLIEVMVAMAILAITALGGLNSQYYAAVQAQIAHAQTNTTRIAQLLLEDWKSTGGSEDYDATSLGLGFSAEMPVEAQGVALPDGVYSITVDGVPMLVALHSVDVAYDGEAEATLRQLTATVGWRRELSAAVVANDFGQIISAHRSGVANAFDEIARTSVSMTTYIRIDASGG